MTPYVWTKRVYTLPQKKHNFNFQVFYHVYGDAGPGSVTPVHVHQGKYSWEHCRSGIWPKVHQTTLFTKRKATSQKYTGNPIQNSRNRVFLHGDLDH